MSDVPMVPTAAEAPGRFATFRAAWFWCCIFCLLCIGGIALFAAYGTGANTSVVTVMTGLYPMVTVLLAVWLLHERLTKRQCVGLLFAAGAFVLFSF